MLSCEIDNVLSESPDLLRIEDMQLGYNHTSSITFCFVDDGHIAFSLNRTHPFIFNAVKAFAKSNGKDWKVFKTYDVGFISEKPSREALLKLAGELSGDMGENRRLTYSGRAWFGVTSKILGKFSAVSFWNLAGDAKMQARVFAFSHLFAKKIGDTPLYAEYINSLQPELVIKGATDVQSRVDPNLTQAQIADILRKAHVDPQSLSPQELEVVFEFRGNHAMKRLAYNGKTDAEVRALSQTSEGVLLRLRADAWRSQLLG